ncbi:MAG: response regulator transcription factor [Candidatus Melainabacteria bacterium]|nr:response regulator transcription factor [Candidatus Melainabacteria bacterium]
MTKLLVVEDDADFRDRLEEYLKSQRYTVDSASTGSEGSEKLKFFQYDVVVLDWNLPGMNGVDVLREFRAAGGKTPVLMLTGRDQVADKALGLDSGADDYLTKPFSLLELAARIRALLRRPQHVQQTSLTAGELELDTVSREVLVAGKKVELLPLEYGVLEFLLRHPNHVVSHNQLVERVWKSDSNATTEAVRTLMVSLRKKIGTPGKQSLIKTVHGLGYKLDLVQS